MYDLVVIGGGAGGRTLAALAAGVAARVALIEKAAAEGRPRLSPRLASKALVRAARLAHDARRAAPFGIAAAPSVDFRAVMARVREVGAATDPAERLEAPTLDLISGSATLEAYDTVLVDGTRRVSGRRIVIATGSRPAVPKIAGLSEAGFCDVETVWGLSSLPESMIVLGAGAVGLELAQAFARLGSRVTVLESAERILPHDDPDTSQRVRALLESEGLEIHTAVTVTEVGLRDGRKVVAYRERPSSGTAEAVASELLVSAGRLANIEDLNLEAVQIHADPERGIEVDDFLQTHAPHIYALGDVIGQHPSAHAALREAHVVFQNAVLRLSKRIDYRAIPRVTFTDPEVAAVGLSEAEALREDPDARVHRVELAETDRARIDGESGGFAKIVASPNGKIRGATIVGPGASGTIQELVLAFERGLKLGDLAATVRPYPTYGEAIQHLAEQAQATRAESFIRGALRWFYGFGASEGTNGPASQASEPAPEAAHPDAGH
jgi:pyruvate/2-oxoglutarate dehydrogenase complex dihydrolipoamide dehydrogenase (E3) component